MENILLYGIIALSILIIIFGIILFNLSKKLKKLSSGKSTKSLESIIINNNELSKELAKKQEFHSMEITYLKSQLEKTIQHISVVRFDALGDSGGQQSFAIGLTDSHKNGIVISSMYTRNQMRIFAKEITDGESRHKLTDEEKQVINHN